MYSSTSTMPGTPRSQANAYLPMMSISKWNEWTHTVGCGALAARQTIAPVGVGLLFGRLFGLLFGLLFGPLAGPPSTVNTA